MSDWNDGPGVAPKHRGRIGFLLKVRESGGHWAWSGPLNFAGQPSFRRPGGAMDSAALVAWELFRGKRVPTLTRTCDLDVCVHPRHHRRPR